MKIFAYRVLTFEPIISKTCQAPQNKCQNVSFVKDEHTYGKKVARKGRREVIYKGTFISKQSLITNLFVLFYKQVNEIVHIVVVKDLIEVHANK